LAKSFKSEQVEVKLQIMNLAVKMGLADSSTEGSSTEDSVAEGSAEDPGTNDVATAAAAAAAAAATAIATATATAELVRKLMHYILELARYDTNTDIRDRCRSLRALVQQVEAGSPTESAHAREILLCAKPVPIVSNNSNDASFSERYEFGSLSFSVGHTAIGYVPVPEWPNEQPDTTVRDAPVNATAESAKKGAKAHRNGDDSSSSDSSDSSDSDSSDSDSSDSDSALGAATDAAAAALAACGQASRRGRVRYSLRRSRRR
jgi:hypothetical protein